LEDAVSCIQVQRRGGRVCASAFSLLDNERLRRDTPAAAQACAQRLRAFVQDACVSGGDTLRENLQHILSAPDAV